MNKLLRSFAYSHRRLGALILAGSVFAFSAVAFAAITYANFKTAHSVQVTTTQLKIDRPDNISAGQLMVASVSVHGGSSAVVSYIPSDWHLIASTTNDANILLATYYKVAGTSEPSDYTWIIDKQTTADGGIVTYNDVDPNNPIDVVVGNSGFGDTATTSAITTSSDNEMVLAIFAVDQGKTNYANDYFSAPTGGMTERFDDTNTPFGPSVALDDAIQATAGIAGSKSSTISGGNKPRNWATQQIALRTLPPVPTPVSYWKLDESSGNASDSVGGHTFTIYNSPTYAAGKINNAIALERANTQYATNGDSALKFTGSFTINTWVNFATVPSTNGDDRPIVGNLSRGCGHADGMGICSGYGLEVYQNGAGVKQILGWIGFGTDDAQNFNVDWSPSANTWYMITMVWDETSHTVRYYINGVQQGSDLTRTGVSMVAATNPLALGVDYLDDNIYNDYFDGKIDELGIWNSALSAAEVTALYNSGNGNQYPF